MTPEKNDATVLLRLPSDLKAALTREAFIHGRRITAEINMRLKSSFEGRSTDATEHHATTGASEDTPRYGDPIAEQIARKIRELPTEKQKALLTLLE